MMKSYSMGRIPAYSSLLPKPKALPKSNTFWPKLSAILSMLVLILLTNYQFHQIQDKFKKLGKYSFAHIPSCGLASACHQLPAMAFLGEFVKTSAPHPRPSWRYFAGQKAVKRPRLPHFLKTPRCKALSMLAVWNFKIIDPHPDMKLFFLPTISAGFQAGELGEIHFGLGTTLVKYLT